MPLASELILSVRFFGKNILVLVKRNRDLFLTSFSMDLEVEDEIAAFNGSRGFILDASKDSYLLSIDNRLIMVSYGKSKQVLRTHYPSNFFWHATRVGNAIYVQEYGESPTGIYMSEDLENWRRIVLNIDLDRRSKHFHYIEYDPYRKWLIATLGDGNLVRVVYSEDHGETWRPLYRGPWQFVPLVPLRDKIVFGMDSGIARGGVGIYYPAKDRWNFRFFKWRGAKYAQMADLKALGDLWVAAFGTPQAVAVSKDLVRWHPIHVESYDENFDHNVSIATEEGIVVYSIKKTINVIKADYIEKFLEEEPATTNYGSYTDMLVGFGFVLKRRMKDLFLGEKIKLNIKV